MSTKTAEPPPPKGVSLKEWDKILDSQPTSKGKVKEGGVDVQGIRQAYEREKNARAFRELTEAPEPTPYDLLYDVKIAAAEDPELLVAAASVTDDVEKVFSLYESMGGTYKHAFGVPMFNAAAPVPPRGAPAGGAPTGALPRVSAGTSPTVGTSAPAGVGGGGTMQPKTPTGGGAQTPKVPHISINIPTSGAPSAAGGQ